MTTTIQLEIKSDIVKSIKINKETVPLLDIEPIARDSSDYQAIQEAIAENKPSYTTIPYSKITP